MSICNVYGVKLHLPMGLSHSAHVDSRKRDSSALEFKINLSADYFSAPKEWFYTSPVDDGTLLQWQNIADIVIHSSGESAHLIPRKNFSLDVFYSYLLTQIVAYSLTLRGTEVLHATGVAYQNRNYFFLGDSGIGKSTLAARIIARGGKLITDDVLVVKQTAGTPASAYCGLPRLKLYPDSIASTEIYVKQKIPLSPYTDKTLCLLYPDQILNSEFSTIDKIIILQPSEERLFPKIRTLKGESAMLALLHNTFNTLDQRSERKINQFKFASQFLSKNTIYCLTHNQKFTYLDRLIDFVFYDRGLFEAHI